MLVAPARIIHNEDALTWLSRQPVLTGSSFFTSLPDFSEFPKFSLDEWKLWFVSTVRLILSRTPSDGVAIFFQTDIRKDGKWIDKGYLCQKAAELEGVDLLWHKVVARTKPGMASFGRPGYSHLLSFSKTLRADISRSTPDILTEAGAVTWARGTGLKACEMACRFILDHTTTRTVVDPFCGHGTILAVAQELGLNAVGVERSRKRAEMARILTREMVLVK